MIRRGLIWIVAGTVCAVVIVFAGLSYYSGSLVVDGQMYADDAVVDITSKWSTPAFLDRALPEMATDTAVAVIDAMFDLAVQLGKRFSSAPCKGSVTSRLGLRGIQVTGSYKCLTTFEKGTAIITIGLVRDEPSWLISSFSIESPMLRSITVRSSRD